VFNGKFARFEVGMNVRVLRFFRHCRSPWVETEAWPTFIPVALLPDSASEEYQPSLQPSSRNVHQKRCEGGSLVSSKS